MTLLPSRSMTLPQPKIANILGAGRAEADKSMFARAFVETADYQALVQTDDFNFVVGRRGAGKSALSQKSKSTSQTIPVSPWSA